LFLAVIQQGEYIYAFILLAASIITTVYYLRVIRFIYFDVVNSRNVKKLQPSKASLLVSLLLVLITFFNISLFFYQSTLILLITNVIILTFYL
jgi:NADH:ubiquinone oxidoreductase subunit 2 (subunit N)